jgi:hypothetical protein
MHGTDTLHKAALLLKVLKKRPGDPELHPEGEYGCDISCAIRLVIISIAAPASHAALLVIGLAQVPDVLIVKAPNWPAAHDGSPVRDSRCRLAAGAALAQSTGPASRRASRRVFESLPIFPMVVELLRRNLFDTLLCYKTGWSVELRRILSQALCSHGKWASRCRRQVGGLLAGRRSCASGAPSEQIDRERARTLDLKRCQSLNSEF